MCFRKHILVRGNNTNSYSEAGILILKGDQELIFCRLKAHNHVQTLSCITECLELYYSRKLLNAVHNQLETVGALVTKVYLKLIQRQNLLS